MNNFKTGKKFLALVLAMLIAFSGISVYATNTIADETENSGAELFHEHLYGDWIIDDGKHPTCQHGGERYRKCVSCGKTTEPEIMPADPNAHVPGEEQVVKSATCTASGVSKYVCTEEGCGVEYEVETAELGHNFKVDENGKVIIDVVIEPSHMYKHYDNGKGYSTCERCGVSVEQVIYVEHDFEGSTPDIVMPATCTKTGYKETVCRICQYAIKEDLPINPDSHVYSGKAQLLENVPFDCKTDGRGVVVCEECNVITEVDVPKEKAHDYITEWIVDTELPEDAYCGEGKVESNRGSEIRFCDVCEKEIDRRLINPPHTFIEYDKDGKEISHITAKVASTCCTRGYDVGNCVVCGKNDVKNYHPINEDAHKYIEKVYKEPTCTEKGILLKICTYDASHIEYVDIEMTEHVNDTKWEIKEPTCKEDGYKRAHCAVCDEDVNIVLPKDENAHNFSGSNWVVVEPSTCTKKGTARATCNYCGLPIDKPLPLCYSTGNNFTTKEPTCYATGWQSYICKVCGKGHKIEIPKDESTHVAAIGYKVREEATCYSEGMEAQYCAYCGVDIVRRIIPKKPHTVKEVIDEYPQCADDENDFKSGSKHHECVNCTYNTKDEDPIEIKAAHSYSAWALPEGAEEEATCVKPIAMERVCFSCGHIDKDEKIYGNHVEVNWTFPEGSDCTTGGTAEKYCTRCDKVYDKKTVAPGAHTELVFVTDVVECTETNCYGEVYKCVTCEEEIVVSRVHNFVLVEKGSEPTCTLPGLTESKYCAVCKTKIEQKVIPAKGHDYAHDSNGTKYCLVCGQYEVKLEDGAETTCNHFCHNQGTVAKVLKVLCGFFWKLFKTNHFCKCGVSHYHENVEVHSYEYNLLGKLKELEYSCEECEVKNETYKF